MLEAHENDGVKEEVGVFVRTLTGGRADDTSLGRKKGRGMSRVMV